MNEYSSLCLAVIIQAVQDVGAGNGERGRAEMFLRDDEELFFYIDAGQLELSTHELRREMNTPKLNKQWINKLRHMRQAAL